MDRIKLFALIGLLAVVPLSSAALDNVVLTIEATTGQDSFGSITITEEDGWWEGGTFYWQTATPIALGDTGATFGPAVVTSYIDPVSGRAYPAINVGFAVSAGATDIDVLISSALLSFPEISPAFARASAAFTVTDFLGAGTTLTGTGGLSGMAYRAWYNGYLEAGNEFCGLIDQMYAQAGSFGLAENYPGGGLYLPIGAAQDMSSQISFTLTAFGLASGSATFEIIPEPGTVLLLIAGLGLLRRR
jgi:hypothetical protein